MSETQTPQLTAKQIADRDRRAAEKKKLADLEAENANLREQIAGKAAANGAQEELEAENAKLREELAGMRKPPGGKPAPKTVHTQTSPSNSMSLAKLDRVNFFYLKVPHTPSFPDEIVHFDEYLDKPSPSDPSNPMWEVVSMGDTAEARRLSGSSKMALIRCSMEDKILDMKRDAKEAGYKEKAPSEGVGANNISGQIEEFEDFQGGITTISL